MDCVFCPLFQLYVKGPAELAGLAVAVRFCPWQYGPGGDMLNVTGPGNGKMVTVCEAVATHPLASVTVTVKVVVCVRSSPILGWVEPFDHKYV